MNETTDRVILTTEQALDYLPEGDYIHTFRSGGMTLIGCDIKRKEIIKAIETHEVELSGEMATGMKHGICLVDDHGPLFIATKEGLDD